MKKSFIVTFAILSVILSVSCNKCNNKEQRFEKVDLPEKDTISIAVHRFEKSLFAINPNDLKTGLKKIQPEFRFFLEGNLEDSLNLVQMAGYMADPKIIELYKKCMMVYPDVKELESKFSKAFEYFRFYFPDKKIPRVYTYVSGIDFEPVKYADSVLVVALDMYLGSKDDVYSKVGMPVYRQYRCKKDFIVPDAMKEIAKTIVDNSKEGKSLVDYMVYEGKLLYFMDAMLPKTPDSVKIAYTAAQQDWCVKNESNIWSFIIDKKLLYTTEPAMIEKLCGDGPFTAVFSKQSPSRVGHWIGWQIVRFYMENNPNVTLTELIRNQDAQSILTKSKYKPKKSA